MVAALARGAEEVTAAAPPKAIPVRCWNKACGRAEPKVMFRIAVEGEATVFLPCPRCGTYNIRVVRNGVVVD